MIWPLTLVVVVFATMLAEAVLSRRHERWLLEHGAREAGSDPYLLMAFAYPLSFLLMIGEGAWRQVSPAPMIVAGAAVWFAGKALKYWAIATLGRLWSFRVLVVPGVPLVRRGPYRYVRHPNYIGIVGELSGVLLAANAPVTGTLALAGFGWLLRRRIDVEERALGLKRSK